MRTNKVIYLPGLKSLMEGRKVNYVATQIGIDPNTLSQLIGCSRGASLAMALKVAAYFNTSVERLVEAKELATV